MTAVRMDGEAEAKISSAAKKRKEVARKEEWNRRWTQMEKGFQISVFEVCFWRNRCSRNQADLARLDDEIGGYGIGEL